MEDIWTCVDCGHDTGGAVCRMCGKPLCAICARCQESCCAACLPKWLEAMAREEALRERLEEEALSDLDAEIAFLMIEHHELVCKLAAQPVKVEVS